MSIIKRSNDHAGLQEVIDAVESELLKLSPDSPEFAKTLAQLEVLHKIKSSNKTDRVSKDVLAGVVANLGGILLILSYERVNVVTSKALGFVGKIIR